MINITEKKRQHEFTVLSIPPNTFFKYSGMLYLKTGGLDPSGDFLYCYNFSNMKRTVLSKNYTVIQVKNVKIEYEVITDYENPTKSKEIS